MQNSDELHLRAELRGHEEDVSAAALTVIRPAHHPRYFLPVSSPFVQVRAVISCPIGLVTASRDKTIRIWTEAEGHYSLDKSLVTARGPIAVNHLPVSLLIC